MSMFNCRDWTHPPHEVRNSPKYLVGTMDKWNDGKKAEERDRVKHDTKAELEKK